jgi:hypothetical protein
MAEDSNGLGMNNIAPGLPILSSMLYHLSCFVASLLHLSYSYTIRACTVLGRFCWFMSYVGGGVVCYWLLAAGTVGTMTRPTRLSTPPRVFP